MKGKVASKEEVEFSEGGVTLIFPRFQPCSSKKPAEEIFLTWVVKWEGGGGNTGASYAQHRPSLEWYWGAHLFSCVYFLPSFLVDTRLLSLKISDGLYMSHCVIYVHKSFNKIKCNTLCPINKVMWNIIKLQVNTFCVYEYNSSSSE